MDFLNNINIVLQVGSNICIVFITVYTAILQFWYKSIRFLGYTYSSSIFYGDKVILQLRNESLSSVSIKKIYILFGEDTKFLFSEYKVPLLVEGRQSFQVEMESVSVCITKLSNLSYEEKVLFIEFTDGNSISVLVKTGWKGRIKNWIKNYSFYRRVKHSPTFELLKLHSLPYKRIKYKDIYLSDSVKFVLIIEYEGRNQTVFINDKGFMSEAVFWGEKCFNSVEAGSYDVIKSTFDEVFVNNKDIKYKLYPIELVSSISEGF